MPPNIFFILPLDEKETKKIQLNDSIMKYSNFLANMFPDQDEDEEQEIPINYCIETVELCLTFCDKYKDDPFTIKIEPIKTTVGIYPEWCALLLDIKTEKIFDLMKIANFLGIEILVDTTCLKIASLIKDSEIAEIKEKFNIKEDFTEEEKKEILGIKESLELEEKA